MATMKEYLNKALNEKHLNERMTDYIDKQTGKQINKIVKGKTISKVESIDDILKFYFNDGSYLRLYFNVDQDCDIEIDISTK